MAVGTALTGGPRTDPRGVRDYRTGLLPHSSLARIRLEIVVRLSAKRPLLVFPQMSVNPRLCPRRHNLGHVIILIRPRD